MENSKENNTSTSIFKLSKESWYNIFSYIDLKSFLNLEKISKYFRKIFLDYYIDKNTIKQEIINYLNKKSKDEIAINLEDLKENFSFPNLFFKDIKKLKKNIIEKYCNFLIQIPYSLAEFCGIYSNKSLTDLFINDKIKVNDIKIEINESFSCTSIVNYNENYQFYNYKNLIIINNLKFMFFYNNTLNVYEINNENIFEKKFCQLFGTKIIFFNIIQNSIYLIDEFGNLISMNINDFSTKIKKIRFYIPEKLSQIFYISNYFIFLTKSDNIFFIEYDSIFSNIKKDEDLPLEHKRILEKFPNEEKSILKLFPIQIKKNYEKIIEVKATNNNYLMFIDSNYDIFGLNHNEIDSLNEKKLKKNKSNKNSYIENNIINPNTEKEKSELYFYKICKDIKFRNYYTMAFGENHWILLEQNFRLPLNQWNNEEVIQWFEKELCFDDYLKVIKYQNVTGKNIIEGDKKYFKDILGMSANKIKQLCNKEIKKVEDGSIIGESKFFGYGNNKYGQLGFTDIKYTKIPKKMEIPINEIKNNNDFVNKIICANTLSILLTKKGKIYTCGNFNPKEKNSVINGEKEEKEIEIEKNNNKKKKNRNKKGKENKGGKKEEIQDKNLWVEISHEIKRNFSNNFYVRLSNLYIQNNIMYIFGLKINKKDFI